MWDRCDQGQRPEMDTIGGYVATPLWDRLRSAIHEAYGVEPVIEYSRCTMQLGWNVKYRKGSRALVTCYPQDGFFQAMVVVGERERHQAELLLPTFTPQVQALYAKQGDTTGARWLTIDVTSEEALRDVLALVSLRQPVKAARRKNA